MRASFFDAGLVLCSGFPKSGVDHVLYGRITSFFVSMHTEASLSFVFFLGGKSGGMVLTAFLRAAVFAVVAEA